MPKRTHTDPLDEDDDEEEDEDDDEEDVGSLLAFRATQRTSAMAQRSTPRTRAVEDAVIRCLDERPVTVFALDEERADDEEGTEAARAASRSVVEEEEEAETKIYFEGRPPPVYESNDDVVAKMRAKKPRTGAEIRGEALRLDAARRLKSTDAFDMSRVVGGVEREKKLYDERRRLGQRRG
jgi:hypothetical protein